LAIERVNSNNDAHIQAIANRSVITEETTHNEPFEVTADATPRPALSRLPINKGALTPLALCVSAQSANQAAHHCDLGCAEEAPHPH
jgi:hypothetical protein